MDCSQLPSFEGWDEKSFRLFLCAMCVCAVGGVPNASQAVGEWNVMLDQNGIDVRKNTAKNQVEAKCDRLPLPEPLMNLSGTNIDVSPSLLTECRKVIAVHPGG
jgi:hypothetical protein